MPTALRCRIRCRTKPGISGRKRPSGFGLSSVSLLLLAALAPDGAKAQQRAHISAVTNVVRARNGQTGRFIVGRIGVVLVTGDGVRTGARSAAGVTFGDGTVLRVGELSDVTIHPGNYHDIHVNSGSLHGDFRGPGRISGRYAVAAVRGSSVMFEEGPSADAVRDYPAGPGVHEVDVAPAGTQLISGIITTTNGNQIQSPALIDSPEDWMGARLRLNNGANTATLTVTAFDPATGTATLNGPVPPSFQIRSQFLMVRPFLTNVVTLRPGFEVQAPAGGVIPNPRPTPSLVFAGGQENPSFNNATPGLDQQLHVAGPAPIHEQFRGVTQYLDTAVRSTMPVGILAPGVQTGKGAPAGLPPDVGPNQAGPGGVSITIPGAGGLGSVGVTIPGGSGFGNVAVSVGASTATRAEGGLRVNQPEYAALGYQGPEQSAALGHAQASAVLGHFFLRGGLRLGNFGDRNRTDVDEAMVHYRSSTAGDVQIGRFHWFPGPVTNNTLGRLISFYTADGLRWRLPLKGAVAVDTAYFKRIDPLQGPATSGYAARFSTPLKSAQLGVTGLMGSVRKGSLGASVDLSVPIIPQRLETYGEVGRDLLNESLYALGFYVPYFFNKYRSDVYLEYSHRQNFGGEMDLTVHFPIGDTLGGLATLSKFGGRDWQPGMGLISRF